MDTRLTVEIAEATRLTRQGRLGEATAVLRRGLAAWPPHGPTALKSGVPQRPAQDAQPVPGAVPPVRAGGSWRSPQSGEAPPRERPGGGGQPPSPDARRGLLDRIGQYRAAYGLDGPVRPAAKPVPTPLPGGARFEDRTYANESGRCAYKLYVPSGYDGQALPLVVMLHGCTQSPDDFAAGTRMNDLAEERTFLVAYPAQARSANASKCWNWFSACDQQRDRGEPSLVAGITRRIIRDFPVQPGRVYVAGLSAGGAAAAIMGATYPDLYAAIGVHSGLACGAASDLPSAFAAMRQGASGASLPVSAVPTIVFHGDRDTTVNPVNGDQVIAQAGAAAALRTTVMRGQAPGGVSYTRTVHADDEGRPVLEQWLLHGVGHAWSGGSAEGTYVEPRGPDASREMMRFFLQHRTTAASLE